MNPSIKRSLCKAAIGAGNNAFAANQIGNSNNTLGDQLGVLDNICRVADDAVDQDFVVG